MAISIGDVDLTGASFGGLEVQHISLGDTLLWTAFEPFSIENQTLTDQPWPSGAVGAWVTEHGGGSAGLTGIVANQVNVQGGAGGCFIPRMWVPRPSGVETFSMQQGRGGTTSGAAGTASFFKAAGVVVQANGAVGQVGGTATITGVTGVGLKGCAAGVADLVNNTAAGGAAGGFYSGGAGIPGSAGPSSLHAAGLAAGSVTAPISAGPGNGGAGGAGGHGGAFSNGTAGGPGGLYGGGGGAGGSADGGGPGLFGPGGDGYIKVEFTNVAPAVITPDTQINEIAPRFLSVTAVGLPAALGVVAGFNFYLNGVKNNATVQISPVYTFASLTPSTSYTVTATAVSSTGAESAQFAAHTVSTSTDDLIPAAAQTAIDSAVAQTAAIGGAPGIMFMTTGPAGAYTKGYGLALNGHFRIASVTKTFTGTAVLMAVDKGLISLDDHLSQYLDGYASDPTIQQIMEMRSGIYDYELNQNLAAQFQFTPTSGETVDAIFNIIKAGGSMFEPGSAYFYTNSNYYVLAKILEAVDTDHRTIDVIITADIITPLGLTETYWPLDDGIRDPAIHGYDLGPLGLGLFGFRDVSVQNPNYTYAAGCLISTMGDLVKWGAELRDGTLLSPEMHELRKTAMLSVPIGAGLEYGLTHTGPDSFGYGLAQIQVGSWFGHDGSWLGYDCCVMFEPATGAIMVVMENRQTAGLLALADIWYEAAKLLYPGSTDAPGYMQNLDITPAGIPSSSAVGVVEIVLGAPRGDEDGNTGVPFKVPLTV